MLWLEAGFRAVTGAAFHNTAGPEQIDLLAAVDAFLYEILKCYIVFGIAADLGQIVEREEVIVSFDSVMEKDREE